MRYVYHCRYCNLRQEVVKPMKDVKNTEFCINCQLPVDRVFTPPVIATNDMVAEGYRRTNEPPEHDKPEHWNSNLRHDMEHYKVVSTPSTTRIAGTIDRPNKKRAYYDE